MTTLAGFETVRRADDAAPNEPDRTWRGLVSSSTLAAVSVGMVVAATARQGSFYPLAAFGVGAASVAVGAAAVTRAWDTADVVVTAAGGALASWWLARAVLAGTPVAFLPFGASVLAFVGAWLAARRLSARDRGRAVSVLAGGGAVLGAVSVAAVVGRWTPLAEPTAGVWRAASTLTYADGTAALLAIVLLLALGLDVRRVGVRLALAVTVAGLLATQSTWDVLALVAAAPLVPLDRWRQTVRPLGAGALAGMAVVMTSTGRHPGWWVAPAVGVAVAAAALPVPATPRPRATIAALGAVALLVAGCTLGAPVLRVAHPPASDDHELAWSSSERQWRSSPLIGEGPPRVSDARVAVGSYPGFGPDGFLTVGGEGGAVGMLLVLALAGSCAAVVRRRDVASSCAAAALVAFAVAGTVDFDWQLPALGLLGGLVGGLAARPVPDQAGVGARRAWRRHRGADHARWRVPALGVGLAAVVLAGQLVAGAGDTAPASAAGASADAEPPPTPTPQAPARFVLRGPDATDPIIVHTGGLYYLYTSQGFTDLNVPVWVGKRIGQWTGPYEVLPHLPAWARPGGTWAPDVHQVAGGWALYFTAVVAAATPEMHCIGAAYGRSPLGPFTAVDHPFICQPAHRGSIDARTFVAGRGELVMDWKSDDNADPAWPGPDQNGRTILWAQRLSADGRRLLGQPVALLSPSQAWEGTIIEAPDMIEAWGTYWLFFSGNWYNSPNYGIGVAACQSPFGPCTDTDPEPLVGSNAQGSGPGEESVFRDGSRIYLLYNPWQARDPGINVPRPVAMARLGFLSSGPYLAAN